MHDTTESERTDLSHDTNTLISFVVAAPDGIAGAEGKILPVAQWLESRFAFFEILILVPEREGAAVRLIEQLGSVAPHVRVLIAGRRLSFDELAAYGYHECIGDVVAIAAADELGSVDLGRLIDPLAAGKARMVRMRSRKTSYIASLASIMIRLITGFHTDTRFFRTLALDRQLLSEFLTSPEIILLRFTAMRGTPGYMEFVLDEPHRRRGIRAIMQRADLAARLVMAAAPRMLRFAGIGCALLSAFAISTLVYVLAIWMFKSDVIAGWTSLTSLIGVWMSAQLGATSVICLSVARLLERNERQRPARFPDEIKLGDLFAKSDLLNVELSGHASRDRAESMPAVKK